MPHRVSHKLMALTFNYLAGQGVRTLPTVRVDNKSTLFACEETQHLDRTTFNIIWSCLATVFLCTWVAIHPNIPAPNETVFMITLRRAKLMVIAFIAPELVVVWAMRQWLVARRLANSAEHQRYKWSHTHGFFALMGGFMFVNGDRILSTPEQQRIAPPTLENVETIAGTTMHVDRASSMFAFAGVNLNSLRTLSPDELDFLSDQRIIDFPMITEAEIQDKSKGDIVVKGLVVVHTCRFIIQCAVRQAEHLSVTKLELMTLAFAILNFATYGLWWNKPLNVRFPVLVHNTAIFDDDRNQAISIRNSPAHMIVRHRRHGSIMAALLAPFMQMAGAGDDLSSEGKRVPMFYAGKLQGSEPSYVALVAAWFGTIFGAMHCIAWSSQVSSRAEQIIWRTCSITITCIPAFWLSLYGITHIIHFITTHVASAVQATPAAPAISAALDALRSIASALPIYMRIVVAIISSLWSMVRRAHSQWDLALDYFRYLIFLPGFLYILARVILLVLVLLSMRTLPSRIQHTAPITCPLSN